MLKITKTIEKTYNVVIGNRSQYTVKEFIDQRKKDELGYTWARNCFCCDKKLKLNERPYLADIIEDNYKVHYFRFACKDCFKKSMRCSNE